MSKPRIVGRYRPWKRPQPATVKCYQCMECEQTFYLARNLAHHVALHQDPDELGDVSYWCEECESEFPNDQVLTIHAIECHNDSDSSDDEKMFGALSTLEAEMEIRKVKERAEDAEREKQGLKKMMRFQDHVIDNKNLVETLRQDPKYKKFFEIHKEKSEGTLLQMVRNDALIDYVDEKEFCVEPRELESESDEEYPTPQNAWIDDIVRRQMNKPILRKTNSEKPVMMTTKSGRRDRNLIERYHSERSDVKDKQYQKTETLYLEKKLSKAKTIQLRRMNNQCSHSEIIQPDPNAEFSDDSSIDPDEEEFLRDDCARCAKCNCLIIPKRNDQVPHYCKEEC